MPTAGDSGLDLAYHLRVKKNQEIRKRLIAKGLDPRSNGFLRAMAKASGYR
jgi:hypothetical protein